MFQVVTARPQRVNNNNNNIKPVTRNDDDDDDNNNNNNNNNNNDARLQDPILLLKSFLAQAKELYKNYGQFGPSLSRFVSPGVGKSIPVILVKK
jgi:hypothetical protein